MLRQRILTAVILVPLILGGLFLLPPNGFFLALLAIVSAGAFEWSRLCGIQSKPGIAVFMVCVIALSVTFYQFREYASCINSFGVLTWMFVVWLLRASRLHEKITALHIACAILILAFAVFAIADLFRGTESAPWWLLGMFVIVCVSDIAAYFSGKRFGKNKLAPKISPGKTIEGAVGALLAVFALSLISGTMVWDNDYRQNLAWVAVCLIVFLFSIVGDLYISLNKRIAGVKDSGTLLPGHGGVLDRIDSTLSAAPVYALCVKTLLV